MTGTIHPSETATSNFKRSPFLGLAARVFAPMLVAVMMIGITVLFGPGAQAQEADLDRSAAVKELGEKFSETPVARGLASNGAMVELRRRRDSSTTTQMKSHPRRPVPLLTF